VDIPCATDEDCLGLEACDDPEKTSNPAFECNDDSVCVRSAE
jgi:hypothetical protein